MKVKGRDSKKAKLTVLLLDHHLASEKILQVPKNMLLYWKQYLLAVTGVFIVLFVAAVFFASKMSTFYQDSLSLKSKLKIVEGEPDKYSVMQDKVKRLESQLENVNAYLNERGIVKTEVEGGKGGILVEWTEDNVEEVLDQYSVYLDSIHNELSHVPLGYPVFGPLTSHYGVRSNPFSGKGLEVHTGLDIKASKGDKVNSPASGKVIYAGWKGGYGNCVIIEHGHGLETLYGHLSSINAKKGQHIAAGETIGKVGSTGRSTGSHLHYEISRYGKRINPITFLNKK